MKSDAEQEAVVTVTGTVRRLVPCARHAATATGEQTTALRIAFKRALWPLRISVVGKRNPNGYTHRCRACRSTPPKLEPLEGVTYD